MDKDKNTKYARPKYKFFFIAMKQTNVNTKRKKQGYKTISCLILVLNKLKIMGAPMFIYTPLGT
jgi:hypothetical protein